MREYMAFENCPTEGRPDGAKQEKAGAVFVSSNAYYGYQHVCGNDQHGHEGVPVRLPCRKRAMENSAVACDRWEESKKRRENDGGEYSQANTFHNQYQQNGQNQHHNGYNGHQNDQQILNGNIYNLPNNGHSFQNGHNFQNGHDFHNAENRHSYQNGENLAMDVTVQDDSSNNNNEKHKKYESTHRVGRVKNCKLEEELLREIHGCSYYHWIANSGL